MERGEWIGRLDLLHGRARSGEALSPAERAWYDAAREALIATSLAVQRTPLVGGERARTSLRLERAVPVRVEGTRWGVRSSTSDLGTGGFAVMCEADPAPGERARAVLELPRAAVALDVHVVGVAPAGGLRRVSVAFDGAAREAVAAIEDYLLDQLLADLVFWDEVLERIPG
jgi:hypothetical protein